MLEHTMSTTLSLSVIHLPRHHHCSLGSGVVAAVVLGFYQSPIWSPDSEVLLWSPFAKGGQYKYLVIITIQFEHIQYLKLEPSPPS